MDVTEGRGVTEGKDSQLLGFARALGDLTKIRKTAGRRVERRWGRREQQEEAGWGPGKPILGQCRKEELISGPRAQRGEEVHKAQDPTGDVLRL